MYLGLVSRWLAAGGPAFYLISTVMVVEKGSSGRTGSERSGLFGGSSSESCVCEVCGRICANKRGLSIHKGRMHRISARESALSRKSWRCFRCLKVFLTELTLKRHAERYHPNGGVVSNGVESAGNGGDSMAEGAEPLVGDTEHLRKRRRWTDEEMRLLAEVEYDYRNLAVSRVQTIASVLRSRGYDRLFNSVDSKLRKCPIYHSIRDEVWGLLEGTLSESQDQAMESQQLVQDDEEDGSVHAEDPSVVVEADRLINGEVSSHTDDSRAEPHAFVGTEDEGETTPLSVRLQRVLQDAKRKEDQEAYAPLNEEVLDDIIDIATTSQAPTILRDLIDSYFVSISKRVKRHRGVPGNRLGKKRQRRLEYVRTQKKWRANRSKTARDILAGRDGSGSKPTEIPGFFEHWANTYTPLQNISTAGMEMSGESYDAWEPIGSKEIEKALQSMAAGSSCGPDGVSVKDLKSAPMRMLVKWLNLFLLTGKLPRCLKRSTTVFIPKKKDPKAPNDFRPISLSSVISRLFNKILAKRVLQCVKFDYRQRGFLPIDGCAENIVLLEELLSRSSRKIRKRPLFVAMLDIKNAFGSVAHEAVVKALACSGASQPLVDYVSDLYSDYRTVLSSRGREKEVVIRRGILQGDCLSPVLFNLVMDHVLKKIPTSVGFPLTRTERVNGMVFADDLNLITESALGMQTALDAVEKAARPLGLFFNAAKCSVLANIALMKKTKWYSRVDSGFKFKIGGNIIPMVKKEDTMRYLGAHFNARGLVNVPFDIEGLLGNLKRAPLKPQQKLYVLRVHLLPKLIHHLCFADWNVKMLEKLDRTVLKFLKGKDGLLRLPTGTNSDFFYTPVAMGGLGLMCFRRSIPAMTLRRFERLLDSSDPIIALAAKGDANRGRVEKSAKYLFNYEDILGDTTERIRVINRRQMLDHIDGKGLEGAPWVSYVHQWANNGCLSGLSGKQFVDAVQLRINSLPTKSITCRGQSWLDRTCRACGLVPYETNEHILQCCKTLREARTKRHNKFVEVVKEELEEAGYRVVVEPHINVGDRVRKPDLIAVKGRIAYVLDAQIIGDHVNPTDAYNNKVEKYRSVSGLDVWVKERFRGIDECRFGALIVSRRGIVCLQTDLLREELALPKSAMCRLVLSVLRGSLFVYGQFKYLMSLGTRNRVWHG